MPMGMFSGAVRALKRYLYNSYCSLEIDMSRTTISRQRLVLQKRVSYTIGIVYLMMCTFYIFLYAVRVKDNDVVSSVLMSVAFSDGLEVLVTGPLVMMVTAGVFPMLAVGLIGKSTSTFLTAEGWSTRCMMRPTTTRGGLCYQKETRRRSGEDGPATF